MGRDLAVLGWQKEGEAKPKMEDKELSEAHGTMWLWHKPEVFQLHGKGSACSWQRVASSKGVTIPTLRESETKWREKAFYTGYCNQGTVHHLRQDVL